MSTPITYTPSQMAEAIRKLNVYPYNRELSLNYSLSSDYQEVEYVSFPGGQHIKIPYTYAAEIFIKGQDDSTDSYTLQRCVAGYREQSQSDFDWNARLPRETSYNRFFFARNVAYSSLIEVVDNGDNSVSSLWFSTSRRNTGGNSYLYLGKYFSDTDVTGGSPFIGKIIKSYMQHCNFVNGDRVFDWYLVPCYRKADNVIGFYDVINDVFYTNEGSGVFEKGPDVN